MNPIYVTFEDYQAKYEASPVLPTKLNAGFNLFRKRVHCVFSAIEKAYQQGPDVVIKTIQLSVSILSCFPSLESSLKIPKQFCKEAKNFTDLIKNLKSIDGLLNFSKFYSKSFILDVSGTLLFILSSITIIDRFQLLDVSIVKVNLAAIPVLGLLPYGGLIALSIFGLMGPTIILSLEKKRKLEKEENRIKSGKLAIWSQSLNLTRVGEKQTKYKFKIAKLEGEIKSYSKLIKNGQRIKQKLQRLNQVPKVKSCQKAIQELTSLAKDKQAILDQYNKKYSQWASLKKKWDHIPRQELEDFRQAKENKWQAKLNKIDYEKKGNLLTIGGSMAILTRQIFAVGSVLAGYGVVALPLLFNTGLEVVISGGGIANFFIKRTIQKMELPSIDLACYVNLN